VEIWNREERASKQKEEGDRAVREMEYVRLPTVSFYAPFTEQEKEEMGGWRIERKEAEKKGFKERKPLATGLEDLVLHTLPVLVLYLKGDSEYSKILLPIQFSHDNNQTTSTTHQEKKHQHRSLLTYPSHEPNTT